MNPDFLILISENYLILIKISAMALFTLPRIRISGMAACVPAQVVSNADYRWVSAKERVQLIKTVGVEKKRVAPDGTTTSDLCVKAAGKLLEDLGWNREEIQLVIFVSQARDYLIPATAGIIQDRLGLSKSTISIDINLGCSGFVYGLSVMGSIMNTTGIKKGLLMVGDIAHVNASYRDKSTFRFSGMPERFPHWNFQKMHNRCISISREMEQAIERL